jgi:glycosyltransferase involved in cell wall biosynthesis
LRAVLRARHWGADFYYVWPLQAAALASRLGLSTILEAHDLPQGRLGPWLFAQFLQGEGARRLLPITESLRTALEATFQIPLQAPFVEISPLGVDLERYANLPNAAEARRQLGLEEALTAGYTGHLYPGRGIELLAELASRNPSIKFLWVGGEESSVSYWRQRLDEAKIENVHAMGFIPNLELPLHQAACDVLLMPYERRISVSSGGDTARFASPLKVFEYLAAGRAIISSDLPVLREVLDEGNAMLVPPEDPEPWDEALSFLMNHPDQRETLALQARQDAGQYAWVERVKRALKGLDAP